MTNETKVLGGILAVSIAMVIGAVVILSRGINTTNENNQSEVFEIDYTKGQKIGSDSAKIKLVEFSDFQCPACAAAQPTVKEVVSSKGNDIQFIYRHFPLPQHKNAQAAALFAEAAARQGKFWEIANKLFETQQQWQDLADPKDFFLSLAQQEGMDKNKIIEDMNDPILKQKIDEDIAEANRLKVNSTPTFFLDGKKLFLSNYNQLKIVIEQSLAEKQ